MVGIAEQKILLRAIARAKRKELHISYKIAAQKSIYSIFLDYLDTYHLPYSIGLYWPKEEELDVEPLLEILNQRKIICSLPKIRGATEMFFVEWSHNIKMTKHPSLPFLEPDSTKETIPNIIVMPLLTCDKHGNRLGYGKGYYDYYFKKHYDATAVGFCYERLLSATKIPQESHDKKLDIIVTENQIIHTRFT